MAAAGSRRYRLMARWHRFARAVSWTPPTSTEIGVVVKSGIAAGVAWFLAGLATGVDAPVLAPLTALVVVQVSVRASAVLAVQRTAAVVLGVLLAVGIGDTLGLNAWTVALLVIVTLGFAELVLRLPRPAARQMPVSALVVLAALSAAPEVNSWTRVVDTLIGAAIGVAVAFIAPASRLVDARQTIERLGTSVADELDAMGHGVHEEWSVEQTREWRGRARTTRERLVRQAAEAVGNSRESSRWNLRDRRHIDVLTRYEEVLPRLERTAIGVSVIARGLDDHAHLTGTTHRSMATMGELLTALADAVRAVTAEVLDPATDADVEAAITKVRSWRSKCVIAATRRARTALEHDGALADQPLEGEWLNYAALLVQVDRIVGDLSAPLPV